MTMFDLELVKDFDKRMFGWITPEHTLVVCDMYKHYEALGEKYRARYKELCDMYRDQMNDMLASEQENLSDDDYYHPAMHRFDPESDAGSDIQDELYAAGYIRLGMYKDYKDTKRKLEAYGDDNFMYVYLEELTFLFDMLDCETLYFTSFKGHDTKRKKLKVRK